MCKRARGIIVAQGGGVLEVYMTGSPTELHIANSLRGRRTKGREGGS